MDVTLIVDLIKGRGPALARGLETDEHLIVVGFQPPRLEDALAGEPRSAW